MIERIEVNLIPAEYRVRKRADLISREIVYPLIVCAAILIGLFAKTWTMNSKIESLRHQIKATQESINKHQHVKAEIEKLKQSNNLIEQKIMALQRINVNRSKWVRLMEHICKSLPSSSWLTLIEESASDSATLLIQGNTLVFPEVAAYMSELVKSPLIKTIDLQHIEQMSNSPGTDSYNFGIVCHLDPNAFIETDTQSYGDSLASITEEFAKQ